MDNSKLELIQSLHASSYQWVLALTGGGTQAAADLLNVPGGSRTVLEVIVPYGEAALADFLGHRPDQYCSVETSMALAARAYQRATWLAPRQRVLGVSATASLASNRPKRGEHRFHIGVHSRERLASYSLLLAKDVRTRLEEEEVLDSALLNALAEACGVPERLPLALRPEETLQAQVQPAPGPLAALLRGDVQQLHVDPYGQMLLAGPQPRALLPGSFNPLHAGHRRLAEVAERLLHCPVIFELSIVNVDKPALAAEEVDFRLQQFAGQSIWLSRAPTFVEKAELFPGVVFVLGMDTAVRIVDPKYYGGSEAALQQALVRIGERGCRFLVGGRLDGEKQFRALGDLPVPAQFRDLFSGIAESDFRWDLSSTRLRHGYS